jgi:peptidyl-prolyl cis-trans isomerase D
MLQTIRERSQGWMAGLILFFVCVPFVLWGVNKFSEESHNVIVAEVNGKDIDLRQYQQSYQRYRQQVTGMLGKAMSLPEETMKQEALNQLVEAELLSQYARDKRLRVGNKMLAETIRDFDAFKEKGKFSQPLYERRTQVMGYTPVGFEEKLRQDLVIDQVRSAVADTAFLTEQEVTTLIRLQKQKRDIGYGVIGRAAFVKEAEAAATDAALAAWYEKKREAFKEPERVKIAYLDLAAAQLGAAAQIPEAEVKAYYEENQKNFVTPEERAVEHLLIPVKPDATKEEVAKAEIRAKAMFKMVTDGMDFDALIKANNGQPDKSMHLEGGELGLLRQGGQEAAIDKAAFTLKQGELSQPVRSSFGFHLLRVKEIRAPATKDFASARPEVEKAMRQERGEKAYYEKAERIANLTFEHPDTLAPAAKELGLTVREAGPFARGEPVEGLPADVVQKAFQADIAVGGANSEPIELPETRTVVLRVLERLPERIPEFKAVQDKVKVAFIEDQAREKARARGLALVERLKKGEARAAVLDGQDVEWKEAKGLDRTAKEVNHAVLRAAFRAGRPSAGKPQFGGVQLGTGDYALVEVVGVTDGDPEKDMKAEARKDLGDRYAQMRGQGEWQEFQAEHRARAKVEIHKERL